MSKNSSFLRLSVLYWVLASCGTQDYEPRPKTEAKAKSDQEIIADGVPIPIPVPIPESIDDPSEKILTVEIEEKAPTSDADDSTLQERLFERDPATGYLWRLLETAGVPPETLDTLAQPLEDLPGVNRFEAFGTSVVGGAIFGVLVRYSGSWFLGKPADTTRGAWIWDRFGAHLSNTGNGLLRGGLYGGLCETALAGGNIIPFAGILGQNFSALSAAISLGSISSVAAGSFAKKWVGEIPKHTRKKKTLPKSKQKLVLARLQHWSQTTPLGQTLRYRVLPGISFVLVGSGVGLLVYDSLQMNAAMQAEMESAKVE